VDRALSIEAKGNAWTLASLAVGAAGSALAIEAARWFEEEPAEEPPMPRTGRFTRDGAPTEREPVGASA